MVATSLMGRVLLTAALYALPDIFKAHGAHAASSTPSYFTQGGLGYAPVAIFLFAAAHSMRRHDRAPAWLAWLGYLAALGAAIATLLDFLLQRSAYGAGQTGPGFFGAMPAAIWLVATGVVLITQKQTRIGPRQARRPHRSSRYSRGVETSRTCIRVGIERP